MSKLILLLALLQTYLLQCSTGQCQQVSDPAKEDPWVGTYHHFDGIRLSHDDGYYIQSTSRRGTVTITRERDGYRLSDWPDELFIERGDSLSMSKRSHVRFSRHSVGGEQVIMHDTFPVYYLMKSGGPANSRGPGEPVPEETKWSYERRTEEFNGFHDRCIGDLRYDGAALISERRHSTTRLGDIVITPIGKFMYFGAPDRIIAFNQHSLLSGWISIATRDRPLFNDDGSLTRVGSAYQEALAEEQQALERAYWVRGQKLASLVDQTQIDGFRRRVKPGMEPHQVATLVNELFFLASVREKKPDKDTLIQTVTFYDKSGTITVRFNRDWSVSHIQYYVSEEPDAITIDWDPDRAWPED